MSAEAVPLSSRKKCSATRSPWRIITCPGGKEHFSKAAVSVSSAALSHSEKRGLDEMHLRMRAFSSSLLSKTGATCALARSRFMTPAETLVRRPAGRVGAGMATISPASSVSSASSSSSSSGRRTRTPDPRRDEGRSRPTRADGTERSSKSASRSHSKTPRGRTEERSSSRRTSRSKTPKPDRPKRRSSSSSRPRKGTESRLTREHQQQVTKWNQSTAALGTEAEFLNKLKVFMKVLLFGLIIFLVLTVALNDGLPVPDSNRLLGLEGSMEDSNAAGAEASAPSQTNVKLSLLLLLSVLLSTGCAVACGSRSD
mmetsp:Transcript_11461/g.29030  ORF Transcript_11461/g.29030 Transcript_11461/m.29030 type:complete len:313 (-) Transcript_11461:277-1215(-)